MPVTAQRRVGTAGAAVGLAFVAALLPFASTLAQYPSAWTEGQYNHGYLVPIAALWLLWRERGVLVPARSPWWPPLLVAVLTSATWFVATVADIRTLRLATVPILMVSWAGVVFGPVAFRRLVPIAGLCLLAVPIWNAFTGVLQSLTVLVTRGVVALLNVPAEIEGNLIHIRSGSFIVEDGCAGLKYLLAGLFVGGLYALTVPMRSRNRAVVLGLAVLLPIVANWIRVSSLVVIGDVTQMQSPLITQGGPHLMYGWVIFTAGLVLFFVLAGRLSAEASVRSDSTTSTENPHPTASRVPAGGSQFLLLLLASFAVLVGPALYFGVGSLPAATTSVESTPSYPGWRPLDIEVRPSTWRPGFVGATEQHWRSWTDGDAQVLVDHLVYREQRQDAELIGYASRIAPDSVVVEERRTALSVARPRVANEAILRVEDGHLLVWYWYRVGGRDTATPLMAKLLEVEAFLTRKTASELTAVSTPCEVGSCVEASRILTDFLDGA